MGQQQRILIIRRMKPEPEEVELGEAARDALEGVGALVVMDEALHWADMRAMCGGWLGAYKSVASLFSAVVVIEGWDKKGEIDYVARGQYAIIEGCLEAGTSVACWRTIGGRRVVGLRRLEGLGYGMWGQCILEEEGG